MRNLLSTLLLLAVVFVFGQSATEILQKSIAYHDPAGEWKTLKATFEFQETRPDGPDRKTIFTFDNARNTHSLNRNDEEMYEINGSAVKVTKGKGDEARGKTLRNYYVYLWGLPMKLQDAGTPLSSKVGSKTIKGTPCHVLTVAYEKETWSYFIRKDTYALRAYGFVQKEGAEEFIDLAGEVTVGQMKIPKSRSWYEMPGNKFLGTDILKSVK